MTFVDPFVAPKGNNKMAAVILMALRNNNTLWEFAKYKNKLPSMEVTNKENVKHSNVAILEQTNTPINGVECIHRDIPEV